MTRTLKSRSKVMLVDLHINDPFYVKRRLSTSAKSIDPTGSVHPD